ncbi:MAG TPA: PKD domain-containing protein [Terriglobales bacterium]|nr:PKD domain-containing protein [Terriglobales bacterium]
MRSLCLALLLCIGLAAHAGTSVTPTTTLAKETGNNTSAANSFVSQTNGNIGAGNVSKAPLRTLLYSGAATKIYAHFMGWFGQSNHMNVGYNSASLTQVNAQVGDMMSRGIDGAIIDWYGPNNTWPNQTTIYLKQASEATNGKFSFAVMEDVGALSKCAATTGCDLNQQVISDLNYVYSNYEPSAAYIRIGGRPLILFFGLEKYSLDWNTIRAGVLGNPLFIFRNAGAFTKPQTNGGFSWVSINTSNPDDIALSYLDNFYLTGLSYPLEQTFGTGFKGFNDTLAAWGSNRIMNQNCGQTWLKTWAEIGRYYSGSGQLQQLQVVTWNDYEEGTEFETGIDNCVSVAGGMNGNAVTWNIAGQENTVDHYTVFISLDGQNLMPVADVPAGTHSLDLGGYGFAPASYTLYVKAVGKPSMTNKMSGAIPWTIGNQAPIAKLSVTPTSGIAPVSVSASTAGSSDPDGTIASTTIDFGDGTVVSGPSASHTYSVAGNYTVKTTVTDNLGASSIATQAVSIAANQAPVARLSVSPGSGTAPLAVTADATASSDPDGSIASGSINFGDGTVASGLKASHTYSNAGNYTVTVTVTDDRGASSSATATVSASAHAAPSVGMTVTPTSGSAPLVVSATVNATGNGASISTITINWGDGTTPSSGFSATHTYSKQGTFTVTAIATDSLGSTGSANSTVSVLKHQLKRLRAPTVRMTRGAY